MVDIRIELKKDKEQDLKQIVDKANEVYENIPKSFGLLPYKKDYYLLFLYAMFAYMAELMPERNQKIKNIIEIFKSEIEFAKKSNNEKFVMERVFGFARTENRDALCLLWKDSLQLLDKEEGINALSELVVGLEKMY